MTYSLTVCFIYSSLLLWWQFIGYPLLMLWVSKYKIKCFKDFELQKPFISIIVPTYNEELSIASRVENLLGQDYPKDKYEIIVVDSGSTDDTPTIAEKLSIIHPQVLLIQQGQRKGKGSAINLAARSANGEIILVTDANTSFDSNVLKTMIPHFSNSKVGAVGGRLILANTDNNLVSASSVYWEIEKILRQGEAVIDSACLFHGEINAWRKGVVQADEYSLSEDLDMAIRIRRKGYKIEYESKAIALEPGPTTISEQIIQKKRTTIGTIQCLINNISYLFFPCDWYRLLIFPSHKLLQILSPFLMIGCIMLGLYLSIHYLWEFVLIYSVCYAIFSSVSFIILSNKLNFNWTKKENKKNNNGSPPLAVISYVLLHEVIILLAWWHYIRGTYTVTWQKTRTTRG